MTEIIIGIVSGTISGMGMGGGTILILLLTLFLGLDQHVAQATNLIFFIPTAIASIVTNYRQKYINIKLGIIIASVGCIGAVIGAVISNNMETGLLRRCFGIFLGIISINEIYSLIKSNKKEKNTNNKI